jgi:glycosyltransferase involved in cell wall biosynthesis
MAAERAPRVLLTADTVGGVWTYAVELARELDGRGVEVALATMGAPVSAHQRCELADCTRVTLHESSYKLEWMQHPWADVAAAGAWLLRLERDFQPDLVHLNQFAFGALPFDAPTLTVAHSCVLSWWQAVHGEEAPDSWRTYQARVARGLEGSTLVAAPTRAMLQSLARNYGYGRRGLVLPNGRRASLFAPGTKRELVFAAGRFWDAAKNLAALEQVAGGLPWPVQVAGSMTHPDGGWHAPRAVECLGELPRPELARRLAAASIYALPARYEPFGLSVLEAALSGCALVLGDIPSLREVWGQSALYVPPGDPAALQATLARLIADGVERERMATAARDRALHYSASRMADACLAAYARLQPRFAAPAPEDLLCA